MACEKHGYTNGTLCPQCDYETIEKYAPARECAKGGLCEWRTDGAHSNQFCGKCFVSLKAPNAK